MTDRQHTATMLAVLDRGLELMRARSVTLPASAVTSAALMGTCDLITEPAPGRLDPGDGYMLIDVPPSISFSVPTAALDAHHV